MMKNLKLWAGKEKVEIDKRVEEFTSSLDIDKELAFYDIKGSIAHIRMLAKTKIIKKGEGEKIVSALKEIEREFEEKRFKFLSSDEDIHTSIERRLVEKLGSLGEKLHTGRSRNDQIALDERLYLKDKVEEIQKAITSLQKSLLFLAKKYLGIIMPAYTHLQPGMPILFSHWALAYIQKLERDKDRLKDSLKRVDISPLGAGACAGTSLPIDPSYTAKILGFEKVFQNSLDAVSDRDYLLETVSCLSILSIHLSRISEDLIIYSSREFGFIKPVQSFSTGSSIMPQKQNLDILELIRGKTGIILGSLINLLVLMKGIPLSYNRDMQEDKEPVFKAIRTSLASLNVLTPFLRKIEIDKEKMSQSVEKSFTTATDLVEYLVVKGIPFRQAYKIGKEIISYLMKKNKSLEEVSLKELKRFSPLFKKDVLERLKPEGSIEAKLSRGSTSPSEVSHQIKYWEKEL